MEVLPNPTRRMEDLVDTLLTQTRSHAIRWKRTDVPGAYAYPSRSGSVIVRRPMGLQLGYSVKVVNSFGDVVEQYDDNAPTIVSRPFAALRQLADEISRQYEDGDPLLDSLRNEAMMAGSTG